MTTTAPPPQPPAATPPPHKRRTFVIISQVYVPDPAAVGQYMADAAAEMARRGYRTIVYTARNGYDDPSQVHPARELRDGVEIHRLPFSSFGKDSIKHRLLAQVIFLLLAMGHALLTRRLCGLMVSTSPPACGIVGAIVSLLRRVPVKLWVMDLNPDQLVAMKVLPARSWPVKLFDAFNWAILRKASHIVVLDSFMAERVTAKHSGLAPKISVQPLWPLDEQVHNIPHAANPFRQQHVQSAPGQLSVNAYANADDGRFVLMYSGLHTVANPLRTLLDAVQRVQASHPSLLLMSIGGGSGKQDVQSRIAAGAGSYISSLPYQPLGGLKWSLSAADVHIVAMGDDMVGILHPCKVYGAMAVSRPLLLLGLTESHIGDLIQRYQCGWQVRHGDVDEAERVLLQMLATPPDELQAMGQRAGQAIAQELSKRELLARFCDVLQADLPAGLPSGRSGGTVGSVVVPR